MGEARPETVRVIRRVRFLAREALETQHREELLALRKDYHATLRVLQPELSPRDRSTKARHAAFKELRETYLDEYEAHRETAKTVVRDAEHWQDGRRTKCPHCGGAL